MIEGLLLAAGVGLIVLGLAHAGLPRWLGWTRTSLQDAGPLSALVVRLHVHFVGLFLVVLGTLSVVAATSPPSASSRALCICAAVLFGTRAGVEVRLVPRVVAGRPVRWLHRAALVLWPALAVLYAAAGVIT